MISDASLDIYSLIKDQEGVTLYFHFEEGEDGIYHHGGDLEETAYVLSELMKQSEDLEKIVLAAAGQYLEE